MAQWQADTTHTHIRFKVRHLMISTVSGEFTDFNIYVDGEATDFSDATIMFDAKVDSITTNEPNRDAHLKSDDFFAAEKYPSMTFANGSLITKENGNRVLKGDLTIRETTKTVELDVDYAGTMVDPYGQLKAGFEVNGKINRKDFGLNWNAITEAGGVVVSDEVKIALDVQLVKVQQEEPVA